MSLTQRIAVKGRWRGNMILSLSLLIVMKLSVENAGAADAKQLERGKAIYDAKCSQCHGYAGDAKAVGAEYNHPLPRDFTYGVYKIRTTESGELPTDRDLRNIIRKGMPYTGMPPWPRLTDQNLDDVVQYIKTFADDFSDSVMTPIEIVIPKAPKYSEESARKGLEIFRENKCMDCHGEFGRGDGESAPTLTDDWNQFIHPANLTKPWTFRGGAEREDIYRTIVTGLNGTPMPSFATIEEEDRWHLVNYIHSLSPNKKAPYTNLVLGEFSDEPLDLERGDELFKNATPSLFPVVGQVIEDPRSFQPAANAISVQAVYDSTHVAIRLSWHDMSAQRKGSNTPVTQTVRNDSSEPSAVISKNPSQEVYSDAVALQIPHKSPSGRALPYFLFGDGKNPVDIWFADLGKDSPQGFIGKGASNLTAAESDLHMRSDYRDGEWSVIFKSPRHPEKGMPFHPEEFIPIAFSIWDGFSEETGNKRGITSWYNLYLKSPVQTSPFLPAARKAGLAMGLQIVLLFALRHHYRRKGNL